MKRNQLVRGSFTTEDLDLFPNKKKESMDEGYSSRDRKGSLTRKNSKSVEDLAAMFNKPKPPVKPKPGHIHGKPPVKPPPPPSKKTRNDWNHTAATKPGDGGEEKGSVPKDKPGGAAHESEHKSDDVKNMGNINSDASVDSWMLEDDSGENSKAANWVNEQLRDIKGKVEGGTGQLEKPHIPTGSPKQKPKPPMRPKASPNLLHKALGQDIVKGGLVKKAPDEASQNKAVSEGSVKVTDVSESQKETQLKGELHDEASAKSSPKGSPKIKPKPIPTQSPDSSPSVSPNAVRKKPLVPPVKKGCLAEGNGNHGNVKDGQQAEPKDTNSSKPKTVIAKTGKAICKPRESPPQIPPVALRKVTPGDKSPPVASQPAKTLHTQGDTGGMATSPPKVSNVRMMFERHSNQKVPNSEVKEEICKPSISSHVGTAPSCDNQENASSDDSMNEGYVRASARIQKLNSMASSGPQAPVRAKKQAKAAIKQQGSLDQSVGEPRVDKHDVENNKADPIVISNNEKNACQQDKSEETSVKSESTGKTTSWFHQPPPEHIYEDIIEKNSRRKSDQIDPNLAGTEGKQSQTLPRTSQGISTYVLAGDVCKHDVKIESKTDQHDQDESLYEEVSDKLKKSQKTTNSPSRSVSHSATDEKSRKKSEGSILKKYLKKVRNRTDPGLNRGTNKSNFFVEIQHVHNSDLKDSSESIGANSAKDSGLASDMDGNSDSLPGVGSLCNHGNTLHDTSAHLTNNAKDNSSTSTIESIPERPQKETENNNDSATTGDHVYANVEYGSNIYGDIEIKRNQVGRNDLLSHSSSTMFSSSQEADGDMSDGDFTDDSFSDHDSREVEDAPKEEEAEGEPKSKLEKIANELLVTEQAYVSKLHLVDQVFQMGILLANRANNMFPDEEIPKMFSNIKSIYQFHSNFLLPQLQKRMEQWSEHQKICDIMKKFAPFLKLYTEYVKDFDTAMERINFWMNKSPQFAALIKDLQKKPESGSLSLQHHMLEPIQRVPRYELLLKDYKKHLPENSEDKEDTEKALELVSRAAEHTNEALKKIEQFSKLLDLNTALGGSVDIVSPTRVLVKDGRITKISARNGEHLERHLFVFNDLLLLCSYQALTNTYKLKARMDLDGMHINEGHNLMTPNTFLIKSKQKAVEFHCKSDEEKIDWQVTLWNVVHEYTKKKLSRMERSKVAETFAEEELGRRAPQWVKDQETSMCMNPSCAATFTTFKRRHHCRACGIVVCGECSSMKAPLAYDNNKYNRVCDNCYTILMGREVSKISKNPHQRKVLQVNAGEKNLVEGYLYMSTDKRGWQKRWFTVKEDLVMYSFKAHQDVCAMTSLPLPGYQVEIVVNEEGLDKKNVFKLSHMGGAAGSYYFHADSKENIDRWIRVLEKVVLAELPEDYAEEQANEEKEEEASNTAL